MKPHLALLMPLSTVATVSVAAAAQSPVGESELQAMRTPVSPAFTVLGITPVAVERPTTPRALAVQFLSKTSGLEELPRNYAIEFAPYWLLSHPTLQFEDYYEPTVGQAIVQTLSVSFATTDLMLSGDTAASRVGFGLRAQPLAGRGSSRLHAAIDRLDALQDEFLDRQIELSQAESDTARARLGESMDSLAAEMRSAALRLHGEQERVGLLLDFAAAWGLTYPAADFDRGRLQTFAGWLAGAYRWEYPWIDAIGLLRYVRNVEAEQNLVDLGGRLAWRVERVAFSGEAVRRFAFDLDIQAGESGGRATLEWETSWRIAATLEYRLSDDTYLLFSYGRDHTEPGTGARPVIAQLGVNIGFGDRPVLLGAP